MNAFRTGLSRSIRARQASVSSTGEIRLRRTCSAASWMLKLVTSVPGRCRAAAEDGAARDPAALARAIERKDRLVIVCASRRRGGLLPDLVQHLWIHDIDWLASRERDDLVEYL